MARIYHESDADLNVLKGKKVAVIGFGNQGKAQALCLHDSGLDVTVGVRKDGRSWVDAKKNGLKVDTVAGAVKGADVVMVLIPDEVQGDVYTGEIEPNLKDGAALEFAHGFAITFGTIKPSKTVDVIMMAPKAPGPMERKVFLEGFGVPALIAVHQDHTGKAKSIALALAKGLGSTKAGVLETDFREEATSDLFGEQAVLCGGVTAGQEGLPAGDRLLRVLARGEAHRRPHLLRRHDEHVEERLQHGGVRWTHQQMLDRICSGEFAKEWLDDAKNGMPRMKALEKAEGESQVEKVGTEIRALFESRK